MLNNDRLLFLAELARLGSMREVADELGTTTSTVSQQLAVLAREAGTPLLEPDGRRVRLTPAGRRLARHAVTILAAVEAARLDLDPSAEPAGTVRVAGFATAIRRSLLPIVAALPARHAGLRVLIHEHEPAEILQLLAADEVDLGLTYDYNLAPAGLPDTVEATPLWSTPWGLGVPTGSTVDGDVMAAFRDAHWLVNSRNTADEDVVRTLASMAGYAPRITHRADSLDLIQDLIVAGLGVGLLPADQPTIDGVALVPLRRPDVLMRAFAVTRLGRRAWPPLAVVLDLLTRGAAAPP
ncbi:LysR family transcriptional regulator [Dactylosporangium siamense]|uniref:LysR family transcriptional regulator n=1 Tax=Dactylosporangium siamense TaxID=685454 RepID=A0A919PJJ6_9ACTN|nr:LysR family transcriptional regulator [Dactylosporangium siamense]GIG45322.1 LysR family transcriptional regulator [Dactylosporangium siamense]